MHRAPLPGEAQRPSAAHLTPRRRFTPRRFVHGSSAPGPFSKAEIEALKRDYYRGGLDSPTHSAMSTWYSTGTK